MPNLTGRAQADERSRFRVARNPDAESRLPYLIWLPIEGGVVLKAREGSNILNSAADK